MANLRQQRRTSTSVVTDRRIAIQKLFEFKINAIIDQAFGEMSKRVTTATTNVLVGDVSIVKPLSADEVIDKIAVKPLKSGATGHLMSNGCVRRSIA